MQELFSVQGKKAVVTGGTRGIGYVVAGGLLQAGAEVFVSSRKPDSCEQAAKELGRLGLVHPFARHLSQESECRLLVEQIGEHADAIDLLVNNARATWGASLERRTRKGLGPSWI